jgi:DNA-binding XRE family transcriptional regulator
VIKPALPSLLARSNTSSVLPARHSLNTPMHRIGFAPPSLKYSPGADSYYLPSVASLRPPIPVAPPRETSCDVGVRFGIRLRELRRAANMTQIDMAVAFGIDRSYISDVECGKKGISLATLEVMAIGFRIPLSELLRDL